MLRVPQLKKLQTEEPYLYEALQKIVGAVNSLGTKLGVDPAPAPGSAAATQAAVTQTKDVAIYGGSEGVSGTWSNPGFALFGNTNASKTHTSLSDATPAVTVSGFYSANTNRTALRIEAQTQCGKNVGGDPVTLSYSIDAGDTFIAAFTINGTFARRLDAIQLPAAQDVTKVQVRFGMSVSDQHSITLFAPRLVESVPV